MSISHPTLLEIPDHFETERLLLRAPRPGDGEEIYNAVMESLDDLKAWMPWAHQEQAPERTEERQRQSVARFLLRQEFDFQIYRLSDHVLVGKTSIHTLDWKVPSGEIGYWVRSSMRGHGYITEAVKGLTAFAFRYMQATRIEIRCDARNQRSAAVAERSGYVREAHFKNHRRDVNGNLSDTMVYTAYP